MSSHNYIEDRPGAGFLYEFGDLLLAVIAIAIPLVALPLFLL